MVPGDVEALADVPEYYDDMHANDVHNDACYDSYVQGDAAAVDDVVPGGAAPVRMHTSLPAG